MQIDYLHFADIDGDGIDDYIWLSPPRGQPHVYLNRGTHNAGLGWNWVAVNNGLPLASGTDHPENFIRLFGDIDGDRRDDYIVINPTTGAMEAFLNKGASIDGPYY
jgi:hypothetical protein